MTPHAYQRLAKLLHPCRWWLLAAGLVAWLAPFLAVVWLLDRVPAPVLVVAVWLVAALTTWTWVAILVLAWFLPRPPLPHALPPMVRAWGSLVRQPLANWAMALLVNVLLFTPLAFGLWAVVRLGGRG